MATASCAPGLRPELGATAGGITVSSVSELVLWGPTQEPGRSRGAWPGTPTPGLGRPSQSSRAPPEVKPRDSSRGLAGRPAAPGLRSATYLGRIRGDRGSRRRDVSRVVGRRGLLGAERGAAAWEFPPGLCFVMGTPA